MSHCAKCKNPYTGCGNKSCACHGSDTHTEVIPLRDYLEGKS